MNLKKLGIFSLILVSGCREYEKNISDARINKNKHPEERIIDGEVEPQFPDETKNNETLLGVDHNKNGIRDDIDIWINYVGLDFNHRMALRQLAREEVKRMLAGASGDSQVYEQVAKDVWDGLLCTSYFEIKKYELNQAPRFLMSRLAYNTNLRKKAYERFHKSTLVYKSNVEKMNTQNRHLACKFKIEVFSNK